METILFIKPILVKRPWGGERLSSVFSSSEKQIGEAWIFSTLKDNSNSIESSSETLHSLYLKHRELFGTDTPFFEVMIKIIDPIDDLSVQLHPNPLVGIEDRFLGKDECWYFIEGCGEIIYGTNTKLDKEIINSNLLEHLNKVEVRKGQLVNIPHGTIHALKKGLFVYEVQTTSDITYRLYDYNRLGLDGKKRELHIEEALKCVSYSNQ